MKKRIFSPSRWALTGLTLVVVSASGFAQNANDGADVAVQAQADAITLSPGVQDVLDLVVARVDDKVIIPFVEASGRTYDLAATEIVYLREKGVSDQVLSVMLRQRSATRARQATPAPPQASPQYRQPSSRPAVQAAPSYATAPTTTYVVREPAPIYYTTYADYGYSYPYYGSYAPYYGSYGYPSLSFSFGFGSGYHRGGYYGGHGGYYGGHHGGYYGGHYGRHHGGHHGGGHSWGHHGGGHGRGHHFAGGHGGGHHRGGGHGRGHH